MIEYTGADYLNLILNNDKVIGLKQTIKKIEEKKIGCVVLAQDADIDFKQKVQSKCAEENIKIVNISSCLELAILCNIEVPCAVCGILKKTAGLF